LCLRTLCESEISFSDVDLTGSFAELQLTEIGVLALVEQIAEETVHCMELCELLLENENVVYVVEDAMEIRCKQVRFDLFDHLRVACLVDLFQVIEVNRRQHSFLCRLVFENVLNLLDVHQKRHIRVKSPLKKQVIMCVLEVGELQVVLDKLDTLHQQPRGGIKFETPSFALLVFIKKHVRDHLQLGGPFFGQKFIKLIGSLDVVEWNQCKGVGFAIVALELNLALIDHTSVDNGLDSLDQLDVFRPRLIRIDHILTRQLNPSYVEIRQILRHLLQLWLLILKLLLHEHVVFEVLDKFHLLEEVTFASGVVDEVLVELSGNQLAAKVVVVDVRLAVTLVRLLKELFVELAEVLV
jgi:hypothetical protein